MPEIIRENNILIARKGTTNEDIALCRFALGFQDEFKLGQR